MRPSVSIIIPCYGVEKYLDRCLETVVNQSLHNVEIILVDDKSPDKVPYMCDEWAAKDSRVKVIHKDVNEGLGLARNTGLEVASGEYIAFVDSDDFLSTEMYEVLYNKAIKSNSDVVFCNCIEYYNEQKQTPRLDLTKEKIFIGRDEVDELLLDMIGPQPEFPRSVKYRGSVWHAIYKHSIFKEQKVRFVSERTLISEDLVFDIDFLPHCYSVVWIPDALYYHCYNGDSLSHTVKDEKYERMKTFIVAIDTRLSTLYPKSKYYNHLQRFCIFRFLTTLRHAVRKKYQSIDSAYVLKDSFWFSYLKDYPFQRLPIKYRMVLFFSKRELLWPLLKVVLK